MLHNRHIDGIIQVGFANLTALAISLSNFEAWLRILSLITAIIYSSIMIVKTLRNK